MEFGELVEPESRAFWANYDDADAERTEAISLSWKWMDEELRERSHIQTFDQFYLFEGREIFDFVNQTILKNASPICQLENYKTAIYRAPNGGNFLCLSEGNDIDRTAQITELLTPWLTAARRVFAFSFQPAYSYNTTRDFDKQCFIRSLCSSTNSDFGLSFVEPMEDCNLIHGVVAGVSTWRLRSKTEFNCYAIYIDCPTIDSAVAIPILQFIKKCGLNTTDSYVIKCINKSNLYI